jgi:diacylglycerol kinase family enzyme
MARIALAANPDSGAEDRGSHVLRALRAGGAEVRRFSLDELEELSTWAPHRIVVAGGDGSIAPVAETAGRGRVPLGVVPIGTANDFARAMDLPEDLEQASRLAAAGERTVALDLGRMEDRPFVNAANAGLAVDAAQEAMPWKRRVGALAYALGAGRAGLTADPVRAVVRVDGRQVFTGRAWQLIVANTGAFGAGSGVEDADPSDGALDVAVVEASSRVRLLQRAIGLKRGTITRQDGVRHARGVRIQVQLDGRGRGFNVDGELCDCDAETSFRVEARAFRLVVG